MVPEEKQQKPDKQTKNKETHNKKTTFGRTIIGGEMNGWGTGTSTTRN